MANSTVIVFAVSRNPGLVSPSLANVAEQVADFPAKSILAPRSPDSPSLCKFGGDALIDHVVSVIAR